MRGNALYRQQKYAEAVVSLKKVYDLDKDSDPTAATMLMDAYQRSGQKAEADKIANDIGKSAESADPNDKNAKVKQLLVLANAKQYDKAAKVFDELYAKGQITQPNEYEAGYVSYSYLEGKEDQSVKIINEGIAKGIIEPDAQVYNILAQSSYYSNQPKLAIDAWTKGAALSKDGEQNLSLARVYIEEERYSEGKAAAQQALSKGIKDRGEAKQLIAEADAALGH